MRKSSFSTAAVSSTNSTVKPRNPGSRRIMPTMYPGSFVQERAARLRRLPMCRYQGMSAVSTSNSTGMVMPQYQRTTRRWSGACRRIQPAITAHRKGSTSA